jgi:hypothetical protein
MSRGDHILTITSDGPALSDDHAPTLSERSAEDAEHRDGRSRVRQVSCHCLAGPSSSPQRERGPALPRRAGAGVPADLVPPVGRSAALSSSGAARRSFCRGRDSRTQPDVCSILANPDSPYGRAPTACAARSTAAASPGDPAVMACCARFEEVRPRRPEPGALPQDGGAAVSGQGVERERPSGAPARLAWVTSDRTAGS